MDQLYSPQSDISKLVLALNLGNNYCNCIVSWSCQPVISFLLFLGGFRWPTTPWAEKGGEWCDAAPDLEGKYISRWLCSKTQLQQQRQPLKGKHQPAAWKLLSRSLNLAEKLKFKRIIGAVSKTWIAHVQVSPRLAEGSTQVEEADTAIAKAQVLVVFGDAYDYNLMTLLPASLMPYTHFNHDRPW